MLAESSNCTGLIQSAVTSAPPFDSLPGDCNNWLRWLYFHFTSTSICFRFTFIWTETPTVKLKERERVKCILLYTWMKWYLLHLLVSTYTKEFDSIGNKDEHIPSAYCIFKSATATNVQPIMCFDTKNDKSNVTIIIFSQFCPSDFTNTSTTWALTWHDAGRDTFALYKWRCLICQLPIIFWYFWTDFLTSKNRRQQRIDPLHLLAQLSSSSSLSACQLPSSNERQTLLLPPLLLLCHNHVLIWFILSLRGCLMNRDVCSAALYM